MSDTAWLDQKPSEINVAQLKIDQLRHEVEQLTRLNARYQVAYLSIMDVHVSLMLDTMTRDDIVAELETTYAFNLPDDALLDVRAALNDEVSQRAAVARKKSCKRIAA